MSPENLVNTLWARVWNPPYDLAYVDEAATPDFVLTSAGQDVRGRAAFKQWIADFQGRIGDLRLEPLDTFANAAGDRVASRWELRGRHEGLFGLPADGRAFRLTGVAVWAVRDGRLTHNWVERSALEVYRQLA